MSDRELRLAWTIFRIFTAMTVGSWVLAFTMASDDAIPAVVFSLFWPIGLTVLVAASKQRGSHEDDQ